jgi:thioredoxin-dependent peroxiredoxin
VCTKEACQFNDNLAGFQASGVPVIGVSPDDAASHQRFRNKYGLRFPLLTDADHAVMESWGAWGEKTRYGRTSVGVLRSTFLLDEQGRVERAWHNVKADGHAASVLTPASALTAPAQRGCGWTVVVCSVPRHTGSQSCGSSP